MITETMTLRMRLMEGLTRSGRALWTLGGEARVGVVLLSIVLVLGGLVPVLSPYPSVSGAGPPFTAPSLRHPFGTDQLGRDVLTRTFAAAQLDLAMALVGVSIPLLVGTLIGGVLGTTRHRLVSGVWLMVIDAINAFPFLVFVIAIVAMVGSGVTGLIVGLTAANWARYARLARARALQVRDADFIQVTHVLGYSRARVLVRHVLPNVYSETLAYALSDFVIVILAVASLSFLGLGVQPPAPEWGAMMSDGRRFLLRAWWITVFPGLVLSVTAVAAALIAHGATSREP